MYHGTTVMAMRKVPIKKVLVTQFTLWKGMRNFDIID